MLSMAKSQIIAGPRRELRAELRRKLRGRDASSVPGEHKWITDYSTVNARRGLHPLVTPLLV